nr:hypothetical protein Q903MT_gene2648 [Picea sitchensis]
MKNNSMNGYLGVMRMGITAMPLTSKIFILYSSSHSCRP